MAVTDMYSDESNLNKIYILKLIFIEKYWMVEFRKVFQYTIEVNIIALVKMELLLFQ